MPYRNQLLQPLAQSRRLQRVKDQLPTHRRQRAGDRGHLSMGHDRGSHGTVLLADHQLAILDDLVEHPAVCLDNTEVGASLRILHFLRWLCCHACAYRKWNIAGSKIMLSVTTNGYG